MAMNLVSEDDFRRLANVALESASADNAQVWLNDRVGGTTRFANNQITQNVNTRRASIEVQVAFGKQAGSASTTDLSDAAIKDAVKRAEAIAHLTPEDPEYMPPLAPCMYPVLPTFRPETAAAGPERLLEGVRTACSLCSEAGLQAAGILEAYTTATGTAANSGLFAYERRTQAEFSLTATAPNSSGWSMNERRSIDDLDVERMTRRAIERAKLAANPREIPAGKHTVILEPAAITGLVSPMIWTLGAKAYHRGTSAFAGKLDTQVIDERLTLRNRPDHPALLGETFNRAGLPSDRHTWIDRGVLRRLNYDRFTAAEHNVEPSYGLTEPHLSGEAPAAATLDELIAQTEWAILVTHFWYIRFVNPQDLTLTGMTRDGVFLIEDGKLTTGVLNFRFHESPLRAFNQLEAYTEPTDAIDTEGFKMALPAMRIRNFNFSSVTKF